MHLLRNHSMTYDWGSVDAIPRFLGAEPTGVPVAEVWIGTHPVNPSHIEAGPDGLRPLAEVAGDLPYLVKLLAADRPLSLQVHPPLDLAQRGFEAEESAGVDARAPQRSFRDRGAKSEMVYALSSFEALIGFRPTAEILRVLSLLDTPLAGRLADDLRADPGYAGIVRRVEWLLTTDVEATAVHDIVLSARQLVGRGLDVRRAYVTACEVAAHHPEDVGVVIAMLMNRMTLQPGEAAYLETGVLHAYLSGLGLEVMVSSDNVLRAGLTSKHIDREGVVACLHAGMSQLARITPRIIDAETEVFAPPGVDFALAVTHVSHAASEGVALDPASGSVVVCTGGDVRMGNRAGDTIDLSRGDSVYLTPDDGRVMVRGLGEVAHVYRPARAVTPGGAATRPPGQSPQ